MNARRIFVVAIALAACALNAAVFQFSVPVATAKNESSAFLWIPSEAKQVRGVVMVGMTLMEREFAKDAVIRKACTDEQLAIVFLKCGLGQADVQKVLDDFANISGYAELSRAPLFFVGHSAGGPRAKECAIKFAERCFGLVQYRGGVPGGTNSVPPGIPALMMVGQFDEFGGVMRDENGRENWEGGRDALAAFRAANEANLGSIVVEPGAGHFAWSERNANYLALFIRKAAQARIAVDGSWRTIDPKSGWLTGLAIKSAGRFSPAAYHKFEGAKTHASWHFDRELAEATVAYHSGGFAKRDQFIRWQDSFSVDAGARFFFSNIQWVGDGSTFEVHPAYAERIPGQYNGKGPRWPNAGSPATHSSKPILVKPVGGPVVVAGINRLRFEFNALAPASEAGRVTFMACSAGDTEYRYTEHVGMLPRGFKGLTSGKPQKIIFAPLANMKANSAPVKLQATSDSGLPVQFYVAQGPALIESGRLKISELPARTKFPIAVKVVAWQFGSGVEPLIQAATPVEQAVQIERP